MSVSLPDTAPTTTILYVDDEEQALKYFGRGLGKDFHVVTAASAAQAIAILEQQAGTIGVVITDQ